MSSGRFLTSANSAAFPCFLSPRRFHFLGVPPTLAALAVIFVSLTAAIVNAASFLSISFKFVFVSCVFGTRTTVGSPIVNNAFRSRKVDGFCLSTRTFSFRLFWPSPFPEGCRTSGICSSYTFVFSLTRKDIKSKLSINCGHKYVRARCRRDMRRDRSGEVCTYINI